MSPAPSPPLARMRACKALGAPSGALSALAFGPGGFDLARAVNTVLSPRNLILMHPDARPPRARFETTAETLDDLAASRPGAFDLIVAAGGAEEGVLSEVRARIGALRDLLTAGGALVLDVETLAAPDAESAFDGLLFPHLARAGDLGDGLQARAPLPASAWRMMLIAAGLDVLAEGGRAAQTLPQSLTDMHGVRLDAYDSEELATGSMILIAAKRGASS